MFGLPLVPHWLATSTRVWFEVERAKRKGRRRGWRVRRHEKTEPACWRIQDPMTGRVTLYMHPDLIAKLKAEAASQENKQ